MEESTFKDVSTSIRGVFESDNMMKIIFDILEKESRLNLALCCKKFYSHFQKRNKILKTSIQKPHRNNLEPIDKSFLNIILSKYKNISEIETLFDDKGLKILADANLINLEKLKISCITANINSIQIMTSLKQLDLQWNYMQDDVTNLSSLSNLTNVEILKMRCGAVSDISPLLNLSNLKILDFPNFNIEDEQQIKIFKKIEELDFSGKYISDINSLSNFTNLKKLNLSLTKVINITPLKTLVNLEELNLEKDWQCDEKEKITDIAPLSNCINLKKL